MAKIFLRKKITDRIANGHPWIFDNEIGDEEGHYKPGDIISVFSSNGSFIGKGDINPYSKIRIRLFTRNESEEINKGFFRKKITQAWELRKKLGFEKYGRIVFAESDGLPGLIIDKYDDHIVFQTVTLGIDYWKNEIVELIEEIFTTKNIYEKNNISVRSLEGLALQQGFIHEKRTSQIPFHFHNLKFKIDLQTHAKTGIYWEQLIIAKEIIPFSKYATVLDVFCHSGIVGLTAAKHGAQAVTGIDYEEMSINHAQHHATENDFSGICNFININSFDYLKKQSAEKYDLIVLDTPSLALRKSQLTKAMNGYRELHLRSLKLLKPGGILCTTFSSYLFTEEMIFNIFEEAARDSFKTIKILKSFRQSADHPFLSNMPSSYYFKGYIIECIYQK